MVYNTNIALMNVKMECYVINEKLGTHFVKLTMLRLLYRTSCEFIQLSNCA